MTGSAVPVTVQRAMRIPLPGALRVIAPVPLPAIFTGYGPLPAVRATHQQSGDWNTVGETRLVELADGSTARERLTAYREPGYFAYRVHAFTGPLRWLVHDAIGEWQLTPITSDTIKVRWTYTFHPRRLTRPLVRLLIAPLWSGYARRTLALTATYAEGRHTPAEPANRPS